MSKSQKHEFQAETKQVLDIVVNSLYKDKEIFVRELISNASDALEKLRRTQLTEKDILDENLELEINLNTDDTTNQLIIQDFGIGMTEEELVDEWNASSWRNQTIWRNILSIYGLRQECC